MDEISIDRLVLDIPGLTAAHARDLAQHIGTSLATASTKGNAGADFNHIAVDLNDRATDQSIPRLAEAIVSALLIQMGGR